MNSTPQQYSCRRGKARTRIHKIAHWTRLNTQIDDYYGYVLASVCAEVYSSMSMCMAASICMFVYCMCVWACEKGGLGGRSEMTELLCWDTSLCLPLSPRTGTATCPNCKEEERIKELEIGCDCDEEKSAVAAYLQHFGCIHPDIVNKQTGNYGKSNLGWLARCIWWDPLWTRMTF